MTFIITLISLIIERFFHWSHLRHWRWFSKYQNVLGRRLTKLPPFLVLAACVLPLIIVVGVINYLLACWWHGAFQLIFGVIVLLYCMGPDNLWVQTYSVMNELHKDDPKIAIERARSLFGIAEPENSQAFHRALTSAIFIEANQRVFAVVFWFVFLGPVGAVLYRAIALCATQSDLGLTQVAARYQRMLDWIPARLFTFFFALGGHFTEVFQVWKKDAKSGLSDNEKLLTDCGVAALDGHKGNQIPEDGSSEKNALELLDRVLVVGLVLLALIVLAVK